MELKFYARLLNLRRKGTAISVGRLQEWSKEYMKLLFPDMKWNGSQRWSERFRKQWNLSVRMKTKIAQKTAARKNDLLFYRVLVVLCCFTVCLLCCDYTLTLPTVHACAEVAEQCQKFWQFVRDKRRKRGIETRWIINADQTPLWLEMSATTTVDQTGVRSVPIRSAGYQKERVTVMQARSTMVVLDSYRRHLTDAVKENFADLDIMPAVIPSGCTAEVQPLNVSINKSFKASIHQHYESWFEEEGQERLTPAGNIKKPSPAVVLRWISRAWKAVPPELIKKAFLTCGISNALDGFEDGLAMAHWQSQLTHEVDVDDEIFASGFFGNNCEEPESDDE
ncbi:unnamed protein product [Closterium sp. NIES-53]